MNKRKCLNCGKEFLIGCIEPFPDKCPNCRGKATSKDLKDFEKELLEGLSPEDLEFVESIMKNGK